MSQVVFLKCTLCFVVVCKLDNVTFIKDFIRQKLFSSTDIFFITQRISHFILYSKRCKWWCRIDNKEHTRFN